MPEPLDAAKTWFEYAENDLQSAAMLVKEDALARNAGYHAQQAAEKALKAVLAGHDVKVPRTHDLDVLGDMVERWVPEISGHGKDLEWLTIFATESRYPFQSGLAITRDHAERALRIARQIKSICQTHLSAVH